MLEIKVNENDVGDLKKAITFLRKKRKKERDMQQAFGIQSLDGSIIGVGSSREVLEKLIADEPILGLMSEVIPLEINLEPLTDKGREIQEEIRKIWDERHMLNMHFDKQPGYYKLSAHERAQFLLDLLTLDVNELEEPYLGD